MAGAEARRPLTQRRAAGGSPAAPRPRRWVLAGLLGAGLAGCAKGPPPPTIVKIAFSATQSVNPDAGGAAQPVRVRVFRLASAQGFDHADYFSLADPQALLGKDLLGFEDVTLAPGGTLAYQRTCEPEVQAIGLAAAFATLDGARWRAAAPVRPNATTALTATLDRDALTLKPGGGG
jgi:type VI secretion system protein VasD